MMAEVDVPDVGLTASIVDHALNDAGGQITIVECSPEGQFISDATLLGVAGGEEPTPKRLKLDDESLLRVSDSVSIKQILFNINQAICLRLDAIESKLESVSNTTKMLEDKLEQLCSGEAHQMADSPNTSASNNTMHNTPNKDISMTTSPASASNKKTGGGAVVVGMPQSIKKSADSLSGNEDECAEERYVVNLAGSNLNNTDQSIQSLGPNVTLITLNSEEDFPHGTWLGDEGNPEMRVRVPISPSDLLHIHSNCRTAEKMALTLLDYLFDRETQAYSNLSGMGKHGKKQLDPLMIYGVRCHLIHHFNVSEQDWHRIKQNINSKCRTAFRRKVRGLPLTVKAFRGKAPPTYIHIPHGGLPGHRISDLGDTSDDSLHHDDSELQIQTEVDVSQAGLMTSTAEIIQSSGGQIQVLHATPEQVAQLQQTHQIQILQGDQLMQFQTGDNHESIHVAVPMSTGDADGIHIVNTENGESVNLPPGTIAQDVTHEIVHRIPKVEEITDSDHA